ncbi:MAG: hypothetical protein ACRCTE_08085, partial [Cellulosilyticaceae bacterium]
MKDLFDKLGDSLKNTYKEAVDQTQKTIDQTKYRKDIITLKNDLKKLYMQLGKECYSYQMRGDAQNVNQPLCSRITVVRKEIELLEKRIGEVTDEQKDSFEAYKRDVRSTWDDKPQTEGQYHNQEGMKILKFCNKCNIGNSPDATHCMNCGQPF